jgi:hypothetical protein
MIQVTLSGALHVSDISLEVPHVRIFGGVVWDRLELGVIATYSSGRWVRRSLAYQWMLFEGDFRLLFGLIRDPSPISEPLRALSLCGPMMFLNDTPFAEYIPAMQMWRGTSESRLWWPTFHLISANFVSFPQAVAENAGALEVTAPGESPPLRSA